ncbi:hypothetical protein HDV64DRAFT_236403 [Trichoderma sp. TUCIM 5745]
MSLLVCFFLLCVLSTLFFLFLFFIHTPFPNYLFYYTFLRWRKKEKKKKKRKYDMKKEKGFAHFGICILSFVELISRFTHSLILIHKHKHILSLYVPF